MADSKEVEVEEVLEYIIVLEYHQISSSSGSIYSMALSSCSWTSSMRIATLNLIGKTKTTTTKATTTCYYSY